MKPFMGIKNQLLHLYKHVYIQCIYLNNVKEFTMYHDVEYCQYV